MSKITELHFGESKKAVAREYKPRSEMAEKLIRYATEVAQTYPDDMAGFVVFAVGKNGFSQSRHAVDLGDDHPIGRRMLAALAQQIIQSDLVTEGDIVDVLARAGLIADDRPKPE